jgi:hypothetical protein
MRKNEAPIDVHVCAQTKELGEVRRGIKSNVWRRINANRNRYAAAPVHDALEAQAIRTLKEAEAAKLGRPKSETPA